MACPAEVFSRSTCAGYSPGYRAKVHDRLRAIDRASEPASLCTVLRGAHPPCPVGVRRAGERGIQRPLDETWVPVFAGMTDEAKHGRARDGSARRPSALQRHPPRGRPSPPVTMTVMAESAAAAWGRRDSHCLDLRNDDDPLFRLIVLGSDDLAKAGFTQRDRGRRRSDATVPVLHKERRRSFVTWIKSRGASKGASK